MSERARHALWFQTPWADRAVVIVQRVRVESGRELRRYGWEGLWYVAQHRKAV